MLEVDKETKIELFSSTGVFPPPQLIGNNVDNKCLMQIVAN